MFSPFLIRIKMLGDKPQPIVRRQCGKPSDFNCRNLIFLSLPQGSESPMMIGELRSDLDDVDP